MFCAVELKAGRHFTEVTPTRSSSEFAEFLLTIADAYPAVGTMADGYGAASRFITRQNTAAG